MVVNRKQPVAPAPPLSRSSSTQPLPTKRTVSKNATRPPPPSHSAEKPLSREGKAKTRKRCSFFDRLFWYSLSLFTFYAFYTCRPNPLFPTPNHYYAIDPNPLCRSFSSYRVHVLEPYVIPPIKHALTYSHSLAKPYIESTKTTADPYIAPVVHTVTTLKPYIVRTAQSVKALWRATLVPIYQHALKPYYQRAVLPRYNLYIQPHLQPLARKAERYYVYYVSRPLHIQAIRTQRYVRSKYTAYIQPCIFRFQVYAQNIFSTTQTVTIRVVNIYRTHTHPRLVAAWIQARPAFCTTWKHTKQLTLQFADISSKQFRKATEEADGYRRTYVDPHVRKIWDKVAEGTELASSPAFTPPLAQDLPDSEATVAGPTSVTPSSSSTTPIPTTFDKPKKADTPVPTAEEAVIPVGVPNTQPAPPVDTPSEAQREGQYALRVAEASAHGASIAVQDLEREVEESLHVHPDYVHQDQETPLSAATNVAAELTAEPKTTDALVPEDAEEPLPLTTASEEVPESTPVAGKTEDAVIHTAETTVHSGDDDLDDFLRDLGVNGQVTSTPEAPPSTPDSSLPPQTSEEADRAKLADTASKRADIVGRHQSWFAKLDEAITEEGPTLAKVLDAWRSEKMAELLRMSGKSGDGKSVLEAVQTEGERLLKGLETYLKRGKSRSAAWKLSAAPDKDPEAEAKKKVAVEEKNIWETVLSKVEGKFSDHVLAVQAEVHQWYVGALEHERQEVAASAARVKQVAEHAQADIGLDYAWLDDVTYEDWQRYHDLMRISERYEQTAYAVQNGTSVDPPSPPAPLVPALDTLHNELRDVILGFSVALSALRGEAATVFSQRTADDDDDGFFVVKDGQVRKDDLRGVDLGKLGLGGGVGVVPAPGGDEVKILPIDPVEVEAPKEGENVVDASTIVIGKDRVQIEQALKDVPLEPPAVRHEEL